LEIFFDPVVRGILDEFVPGEIIPFIDSQLKSLLSNLSMQFPLPQSNGTVIIDLSMLSDPFFLDTEVQIFLSGDVTPVNGPDCPYKPSPMQIQRQRYVEVYASESVMSCAILAYEETNLLDSIANNLLQSTLQLDDSMRIMLDFLPGNKVKLTDQGILLSLLLDGNMLKNALAPEEFLGMRYNVSSSFSVSIAKKAYELLLFPHINSISLNFKVTKEGDDVPERYKQEISDTDFASLSQRANVFLASSVIPSVNTQLAQGIPIPVLGEGLLWNPQLQMQNSFVVIGTNINSNFTLSRPVLSPSPSMHYL